MNPISKRVKSALMTLASMALAAFVASVASPEFQELVIDTKVWLEAAKVPASVIGFGTVFIVEIWKYWLNNRKLNQLGASTSKKEAMELY